MNLISIADLSPEDLCTIWGYAERPGDKAAHAGTVAWSFEGSGIRTRTTFIQAFRNLGLTFIELPGFLKTAERVEDLAGYMDAFYAAYVIRESDHERLRSFALASKRPVINAMSSQEHPCEVLTDAYYIDRQVKPLAQAKVCLWGPTTNVFRSWHALAGVLGIELTHVHSGEPQELGGSVLRVSTPPAGVDVVITDAWPQGRGGAHPRLELEHLEQMGNPILLPTPPFTVGQEIGFDPTTYARFATYGQKALLLPVQQAVLRFALECAQQH